MDKKPTVKTIACEEICRVSHVDEAGYTVGFTYDECLARVIERRIAERGDSPDKAARTTTKCLRWYAGKILEGASDLVPSGFTLPRVRPRKKPQ